ncbi:MAG: hypothetical protein FWD39_06760 [Clostridiales bacterium]|nr:hypothetical protein [Clostridiales bacterium]
MTKQEAVMHYKAAMAVFEKWFSDGIINAEDLTEIDTIIAEKYGLSSCSIYRRNDLLYKDNYANIR